MDKQHAKFAPSAAHRWTRCPFSVMGEQDEDDSSIFAEEGTRAHKLAECILTGEAPNIKKLCVNAYGRQDFDMLKHVNTYMDYIERWAPFKKIFIEEHIKISTDIWGTADFIGVTDEFIHVIDLKYGKGVEVEAEHNKQLRTYAAGAWLRLGGPLKHVVTHIVQPRVKQPFKAWSYDYELLPGFCEYLKHKAARAEKYPNKQVPGEWCQWCKAKNCPHR